MYQFDDPTVVGALPTPAAAGTAGYFTDGDPASSQQATILRADFMNALMLELLNIVEHAGLTPSKTTNNQVLLAIQAMIATSEVIHPAPALASTAGVVTIDLSEPNPVYTITLTENVTSWVFTNPPAAGFTAEIRVVVTQGAGTAYTCASPASAGHSAGGAWTVSATPGAIESLRLAIDSAGIRSLFKSGVYA